MPGGRREEYEKRVREMTDAELIERVEWFHKHFEGVADRVVSQEVFRRFRERAQ